VSALYGTSSLNGKVLAVSGIFLGQRKESINRLLVCCKDILVSVPNRVDSSVVLTIWVALDLRNHFL